MQQDTTDLPAALAGTARVNWNHILERAPAPLFGQLEAAAGSGPAAAQLPRVLACSPFVADLCRRQPALLLDLLGSAGLQTSLAETAFRSELHRQLDGADVEPGVVLRRYRQRRNPAARPGFRSGHSHQANCLSIACSTTPDTTTCSKTELNRSAWDSRRN